MRDLYRCLDKHSPRLLQAIAEAWHVSLVGNEQRGWVLSLAEAMLAPGALEGVVERFTPQARDALAELAREGGMLPSHRLSTRYGSIRRFGPARLARERPWLEPKNPLEELFYQGIIYRAYDSVYDYYGEVLLVPQQLLAQLSPTDAPAPAFRVQPAEMPARVQQDGDALGEDLLALVAQVRQGQVPASEENAAVRLTWPAPGYVNLGPRLLGESDPERLALIHRLLQRLRLVEPSQGFLRPTIQAQQWLRFSDLRRLRATYLAWRDDPLWDELRLLPSLRCENTGWQNDPVASRRSLLETLAKCSPGDWLSLDSFVEALKRYHPDYLRPDGDYDSWFIRDAQTGDYLEGFESWERVEGALARHIITRPLRWLGALDLGYGGDREPSSFRITERGGALLADEGDPRTEGQTARSPLARVTEDFVVTVPVENTMYGRYQLERFAEWQSQSQEAVYRITAESIWRSHNAGVKTEQIVSFLKRISDDRAAPQVMRALQAWGGRFGRALMRRVVLLETRDQETMQQVRSHPEVGRLLGEELAPRMCLVDEDNLQELTERLKALGIWPQVKL